MRKGLLEFCILRALEDGECYGYDLVKRLVAIPGLGISEGTLYPLLSRLRVQGMLSARLVESCEGPARKYYALTDTGRQTLSIMNDYLNQLNGGVEKLRRKGA